MFNSNCASVPLVASIDGNGNNNGGFGNDSWSWIWVILIFAIFGWGGFGNGFGGGNGGGTGYVDSALQRGFDNQSVMNKLNGLENDLCDGFYSVNTSLLNGFNGVNSAIANLGYQTQQGINQTNVALMQGQNALANQLANCCCENREAIANVRYDMATQACDTRHAITDSTRAIVDNANANTRQLMDFLVNDKIAALTAENQSLKFQASQNAQNAFITANQDAQTAELIRRIAPYPVPAYQVPNPMAYAYGYGCNHGCGC